MSEARIGARIGIDVGGTFTDVALEAGGRRFTSKVLTTTDDPAVACMQALEEGLVRSGIGPCDVDVIIHGTTLATNAILERKGARTSLVTTEGFRDTIEMGTEGRPEQYEINIVKPRPLVPRRRRFTVAERLNSRGEVLVSLDEEKLEALLPFLDAAGTESLTIGFLHSYANPAHEHFARDYFTKRRPAWSITISSDVSPEAVETSFPLIVWRKEYRERSAGPGRWRGGYGQVIEIGGEDGTPFNVAAMFDRTWRAPEGRFGRLCQSQWKSSR